MKRASNWTNSPLYLGKKGFFGGFYPFPSKSENDTKFEKKIGEMVLVHQVNLVFT